MENKVVVKKNDNLYNQIIKIGARIGALGAIVKENQNLTLKESTDFFDRCNSSMTELNKWSLDTANYIDACNSGTLQDVNTKNLEKTKKVYNI